jgi:excisionase family DNA binding protein
MEINNIKEAQSLLTRKQAADLLGCKDDTLVVWKTNKRYKLPYIKIGKNVRYRLSDILSFIENNTHN